MSEKNRIAGLINLKNGEQNKLLYIHSNARGDICVNGEPSRLSLLPAGKWSDADEAKGSGYGLILPPSVSVPQNMFFAVGDGETLLWIGENGIEVVSPGFIGVSQTFALWRPIQAGVLTVSDKGASGERVDTAGPALADMAAALGSQVLRRDIVPDERSAIATRLKEWCGEGLQLILVTGGTGLSKRDVTPEALCDVGDRVVPGFGEIMRSRSMLYTERGLLTRSVAVTCGDTLIISFPGSERAVRQCFEAISGALRHGVGTLSGWDAECGTHT